MGNFKESMQAKVERDCVKSELDGETVYLKHSGGVYGLIPFFGKKMKEWHQIYPPVNEDGSWNIPNLLFGGKKNLVKFLIIIGFVALVFMAFYTIKLGLTNQIDMVCSAKVPLQDTNNTINAICGHELIVTNADGGLAAGSVNLSSGGS